MNHYTKKTDRSLLIFGATFVVLASCIAGAGYLSYRQFEAHVLVQAQNPTTTIEVNALLQTHGWQTGLLFGALIVAVGVGLALVWRQQNRFIAQQSGAESADQCERGRGAVALRERLAHFRLTLDTMLEGAQIIGFDWRYLYLNPAAEQHNRRSNQELLGHSYTEMWPGIESTHVFSVIKGCLEERVATHLENRFVYPDGRVGWFNLGIQPIPEGAFILSFDITERVHIQEQLAEMKRLHATLSQVNQAIVRVGNATELYQTICDVAVQFGEFTLAWIGLLDEVTGEVRPIVANGLKVTQWPFEFVNINAGPFKEGLVATAIRTAAVTTSEDIETNRGMQHVRDQFRHYNYHAAAAIPFYRGGKVIGILSLTASRGGFFKDEEELRLLNELGLDISFALDKMEIEQEKRASEEKYRGLMESLDSIVAIVDYDGTFLYLNDVATQRFGNSARDLVGKPLDTLYPAQAAAKQLEYLRHVISEDRGMVFEAQSLIRGQLRWYHTSIQPIHDGTGRVIYALINATDIHELKLAQQELLDLNQTLEERVKQRTAEVQDLYENAPTGYHSLDANGVMIRVNQTELNWLGYTRREMVGHPIADFTTPASLVTFLAIFPIFKQRGWVRNLEFEFCRKDGSVLSVLVNATAIYDSAGNYVSSRSTVFDNTERKKAEIALRETEEALRHINAELARTARTKDEFLANMSHELRTPLNAILAISEILQEEIRGPLNARQHDSLRNIEVSGRHLLALINDILDLAKVEAGRTEIQLETVVIAEVCQASLQFVTEVATKKALTLAFQLSDQLSTIAADPKRLKQMLVNLLSNAVKFTPAQGRVSLEVAADAAAGMIHFTVADTGIGIAPADMARLFQPFSQLDSSLSRQHEGTGLGLALVHHLAELHGGSIAVESVVAKGSRFTILLPYHPVEPTDETPPPETLTHHDSQTLLGAPQPRSASVGTRILLVEDNELTIPVMTDYLEGKGYTVFVAHNGREALELVGVAHPVVILMDIQMPEMDGLEAMRQLRAMPPYATTPIIALTALAMPGDRERCLAAGANEYMTKPVSLKGLVALMEQLLPP